MEEKKSFYIFFIINFEKGRMKSTFLTKLNYEFFKRVLDAL